MKTKHLYSVLALMAALGLSAPTWAQTAPAEGTEAPVEGTVEGTAEIEGNFNREIPEGLRAQLTDEELTEYQARLNDAVTPQERNEIRRELQRKAQARHMEQVQTQKKERPGLLGLFDKAVPGNKDNPANAGKPGYEKSGKDRAGKSGGGKSGGGKSGGGGKDRGGNGGGGGGGGGRGK